MCVHNIVKFIADYDESSVYSKTEEYLCSEIEEFYYSLIKELCKKFTNVSIEGSSNTCAVVKIKGKIFTCTLFMNTLDKKYYWCVELEEDN